MISRLTMAPGTPWNTEATPLAMPLDRLEMIPVKISRETPLPMPSLVMRSPIHMARAVPPAMVTPMVR